jgi:hypothetical protein
MTTITVDDFAAADGALTSTLEDFASQPIARVSSKINHSNRT